MDTAQLGDTEVVRTAKLLGSESENALKLHGSSQLSVHDLLQQGLPTAALEHLIKGVTIRKEVIEKAVGITARTLQRHKKRLRQGALTRRIKGGKGVYRFKVKGTKAIASVQQSSRLSREQSGRVWKFAEILTRATDVFGSQHAAEQWLESPVMGLEQRKPMDLLSTPAGVEVVEQHLTRLEYGVYT